MTSPGAEVGASISVVLTDGAIHRSIRKYNAKHDCLAMNMNSDQMSGKGGGVAGSSSRWEEISPGLAPLDPFLRGGKGSMRDEQSQGSHRVRRTTANARVKSLRLHLVVFRTWQSGRRRRCRKRAMRRNLEVDTGRTAPIRKGDGRKDRLARKRNQIADVVGGCVGLGPAAPGLEALRKWEDQRLDRRSTCT
ncbi:hypothetical protein B0H14DRAFT_2572237 [Mycena olivaceomarginata]|nr:hypothetical protein B0H14DRAFT_2572237 [Mycena olivaceomarginata]